VTSFLSPKWPCPECGRPRCTKGYHTLSVRTVFGQFTVRSPRLHHCACRPHDSKTFSPLAELLPDRTLPELLFLETKWASLMRYGMTSKLLPEVLPIDEPVNTFTLRQHVAEVAKRLERELGDEQFCFIEGCQATWDRKWGSNLNFQHCTLHFLSSDVGFFRVYSPAPVTSIDQAPSAVSSRLVRSGGPSTSAYPPIRPKIAVTPLLQRLEPG